MINPDQLLADIEALPTPPDIERDYIGASEIGDVCERRLWLKFHRLVERETFSNRMLRLFERGKREEHVLECLLRDAGIDITQDCFSQAGFKDGFFAGHSDGGGEDFIVEYKTHSAKSFDTLKRGELVKSFPKHHAQMQVYMHKFGKSFAIYFAVCKDDDRLFMDVIKYDEGDALAYELKAHDIAAADKPPERIAKLPTSFPCKMCYARDVCFGFDMPRVNCRNCTNADKYPYHGAFGCAMIAKEGTQEQRIKNNPLPPEPCPSHCYNPFVINDTKSWQIVEFYPEQNAVKYKRPNGEEIINGPAPFGIPSKELK